MFPQGTSADLHMALTTPVMWLDQNGNVHGAKQKTGTFAQSNLQYAIYPGPAKTMSTCEDDWVFATNAHVK